MLKGKWKRSVSYLALVVGLGVARPAPTSAQNFGNINPGAVIGNPRPSVGPAIPFYPDVRAAGAKCDGLADDSVAIQNAINAAENAGNGGWVTFPSGKCLFRSTLNINSNNITLQGVNRNMGASILLCRTGNADCIKTNPPGGPDTSNRLAYINLFDLQIDATGNTGGNAINETACAQCLLENIVLTNVYNGVLFYNTDLGTWRYGYIVFPHGQYAVKWDNSSIAPAGAGLALEDVYGNGGFFGADGILWDGNSNTLQLTRGGMVSFKNGLHTINSRGYGVNQQPGLLQASDWAADGASQSAINIEAGHSFMFTNLIADNAPGRSGQGDNDGPVIDIANNSTNNFNIMFTNSVISSGSQQCIRSNSIFTNFVNVLTNSCSLKTTGAVPTVEIGANSLNVSLNGGTIGDSHSNYGLVIDSGAVNVSVIAGTFLNGATGRINDVDGQLANNPPFNLTGTLATNSSGVGTITWAPQFFDVPPVVSLTLGGSDSGGLCYVSGNTTVSVTVTCQNAVVQNLYYKLSGW